MFLSVVIPAFNEEKRLPETLKKVKAYLEKQSYDWEVLIVNDGSRDRTAAVVSDLVGKWQGFRLIDNKENRGKGAVVKQGMLEAKGDWRLYMDADNSTDISEIEKLWGFVKAEKGNEARYVDRQTENVNIGTTDVTTSRNEPRNPLTLYEIIAGSRYLKKDSIKIKQPLIRRIVSRLGNILIRTLLGIHSVDTQCGFKMFSAKATKEIFPLQTMERWGAEMEIWAIAIKKGYKVKEVAVDWYDAKGSTVRKSAALQTLKELLIIKWNLMRGKYSR